MTMFKIEDIAMMLKCISEKRLRKSLNIRDMVFDETCSNILPIEKNVGNIKYHYILFFKIKQTVNRESYQKLITEAVIEEIANKLDLFYDSKYYSEPVINDSFESYCLGVLSKSKSPVGVGGNINYLKIKITIDDGYGDGIINKIKTEIRDLKLSQLRI